MVDLHAGKPFEGGSGYVVIIAHTANRRVWIKAGEDGILDNHSVGLFWDHCRILTSDKLVQSPTPTMIPQKN